MIPQAGDKCVANGNVLPRRPSGFYSKGWLSTSLHRKCVWSGKTFKSELLCGQGNANDYLTGCHRRWIFFPPVIPGQFSFCLAANVVQTASRHHTHYRGRSLFPASLLLLSSLYCMFIPGRSRIYKHASMILICICLLCYSMWLLFYFMNLCVISPGAWKVWFSLTQKFTSGHTSDLLYDPWGHGFHPKLSCRPANGWIIEWRREWREWEEVRPETSHNTCPWWKTFASQKLSFARQHHAELVIIQHQPFAFAWSKISLYINSNDFHNDIQCLNNIIR